MASDVEPGRVGVETRRIVVYPSNRTADLIRKHHEAASDILYPGEVGHDIMRAGSKKHFGRGREILGAAAAPSTAMDKDEDRRQSAAGAVDVELLNLRRSISEAFGLADA